MSRTLSPSYLSSWPIRATSSRKRKMIEYRIQAAFIFLCFLIAFIPLVFTLAIHYKVNPDIKPETVVTLLVLTVFAGGSLIIFFQDTLMSVFISHLDNPEEQMNKKEAIAKAVDAALIEQGYLAKPDEIFKVIFYPIMGEAFRIFGQNDKAIPLTPAQHDSILIAGFPWTGQYGAKYSTFMFDHIPVFHNLSAHEKMRLRGLYPG